MLRSFLAGPKNCRGSKSGVDFFLEGWGREEPGSRNEDQGVNFPLQNKSKGRRPRKRTRLRVWEELTTDH